MRVLAAYFLFFVLLVASQLHEVSGKSIRNEKILVLNETVVNYHVKHIPEGSAMFIQFYAPGCDYCKALAPDWVEISESDIPNVQMAVVNCEAEQHLCRYWEISEVPSLYLLKDRTFYLYTGDRVVDAMKEFITTDYMRSPSRDLPKPVDYRALKRAKKQKKKLRKQEELFWIPDVSSPSFLIGAGTFITVLFLSVGYFCAPSVEEEKDATQTNSEDSTDSNETNKPEKERTTEETIKPTKDTKKARKRPKKDN